jgi:hypothetical protein
MPSYFNKPKLRLVAVCVLYLLGRHSMISTIFESLQCRDEPWGEYFFPFNYGLINYVDTKAKCCILNKFSEGTLRQVFICLRPPPLLGFCLLWSSLAILKVLNLVIYAENGLQQDSAPPPPLPATDCLCILYFDTGKGGGLNQREG